LGGIDPRGPVGPFSNRVLHGGDWNNNAYGARCACRGFNPPSNAFSFFGFRCVRGL
jgi:formylglycine-generating enzyme required for sulfatase activity